ncbi:helix-turn-helix transcriptional regulator [Sphaerotilaceae bacterium SBD11-9]
MLYCSESLNTDDWHGLPLLRMRVPPTNASRLHQVDRPLLMVLTRGSVALQTGKGLRGSACHQGPGSASLLPPHADYEGARWTNDRPSEFLCVELPEAIDGRSGGEVPTWALPGARVTRFDDTRTLQWLRELEAHCLAGQPFGSLYTESVSTALVAYLGARFGEHHAAQQPARVDAMSSRRVVRVRRYVDERLAEPLRTAELAALAGYSPQHFARAFKSAFGTSLHQYVLSRRIELARNLLAGDHLSLAEIALACGFSSQGHFGLVFKAREGIAPGAYRRSLRG